MLTPRAAHVLMISFLLGGCAGVLMAFERGLAKVEGDLLQSLKVVLYLNPTLSEDAARAWTEALPAQDNGLESVTYIPKSEALNKAQGNPALAKALLLLRENPLPTSAVLRYKSTVWIDRDEPAAQLQGATEIQQVVWDPEVRSHFRAVNQWRMGLLRVSIFGFLMLVIWASVGIFRFFTRHAPLGELVFQMGIGLVAGGLSLAVLSFGFSKTGPEAVAFLARPLTGWPMVVSLLSAVATYGWKGVHEE